MASCPSASATPVAARWYVEVLVLVKCRLEVGTESSVDRSKPVRSYLMPLFPGNSSIEVWGLPGPLKTSRSCTNTVHAGQL